jgi:hypothetical protein
MMGLKRFGRGGRGEVLMNIKSHDPPEALLFLSIMDWNCLVGGRRECDMF